MKGDLDTIILKALQKSPERRYNSVEQFSEDLRRHLFGLPISARPDTFQYRLSKFIERNKVGVAAAVLIFLSLITGISVASWQAYQAEKQRLLAEKRFAEVRTITNNFVYKYTDEIPALPSSMQIRQKLLQDGGDYLNRLAVSTDDFILQKELALAYVKLGNLQGKPTTTSLGDTVGAIESYEKAIRLLENLYQNTTGELREMFAIELLKTYRQIGLTFSRANQDREKRKTHFDELGAKDAKNLEAITYKIDILLQLIETQTKSNQLEKALITSNQTDELWQKSTIETEYNNNQLGKILLKRGVVLKKLSRLPAAKENLQKSLEIMKKSNSEENQLLAQIVERELQNV